MSISTVEIIMGRIESATENSPIAVFKLEEKCGKLNAVFGDTVITQQQIKSGHKDLIGVFHKGMDLIAVKRQLQAEA